ncbi:MAG: squalene/phytoene synthase family protein [Acidobacteriota bacterium]
MGARSPAWAWEACYGILPKVSRTFALSIAQLKEPLKGSVCVSYLLCRILDTVEDAPGLAAADRWRLMEPVLLHIKDLRPCPSGWGEAAARRLEDLSAPSDRDLLRSAPAVLAAFASCGGEDRLAMARWVTEMGKGMVAWSERMGEGAGALKRLPSMAALDRYCYYIAGTVGYLLTDLYYIHSPHVDRALFFRLQADAEEFGLGLQKVNIVKDLAEDFERGWCFIPEEALAAAGVSPVDFSNPARHEAVYAGVLPVLRTAAAHLERAWAYLSVFPLEEKEVRFFLATSLFFALETLALVAEKPSRLTAPAKLKISRAKVAALAAELRLKISRPRALSALYADTSAPLRTFGA